LCLQHIFGSLKKWVYSPSIDEVTTLDCQSWLVVYVYIVDGWKCISILLTLEQVVNGGRTKHVIGKHASIWGLFKF
jgi:hypothetical protein